MPGRCGHVWKPPLRLPVCRIKKEINGQTANVSCFFGLQSFKESLAEQAVWHRQKRFSKKKKKKSRAQPTYSLSSAECKSPPHTPHIPPYKCGFVPKREMNGLFQQHEIYCQEYLLQQKQKIIILKNRLNTQIYLAFCSGPTSQFSDHTPKQCSQNI